MKAKGVALLWDESYLWGLMAYKVLKGIGLPFDLIKAEDIKLSWFLRRCRPCNKGKE
jgi:hypothetical protein